MCFLLADFETDKIAKMIALGAADGLLPPVDLCSYLNLSETRALIHALAPANSSPSGEFDAVNRLFVRQGGSMRAANA